MKKPFKLVKDVIGSIFIMLIIISLFIDNHIIYGLVFISEAGLFTVVAIELRRKKQENESILDRDQLIQKLNAYDKQIRRFVTILAIGFGIAGLYSLITYR